MESPDTLRDAVIWFSEFEHCRQFMMQLRWPDGVVRCPQCGAEKVTWIAKQRVWKCYAKHQRPTFTLKTGTIFEDSPIPLEKWLCAAWLLINCKNGVSSYEIHRGLGVTQKTAWFMLHRIRLAMQDAGFNKLGGEVEVDETFIGGKARNMHKSKRFDKLGGSMHGTGGKETVFGIVERGGRVRPMHVSGRGKPLLQEKIREHVEAGSAIFSDELHSYDGLSPDFKHEVVNHAVEYVRGNVHTNTMENFWSLLKRGLHGTYISVEPFHLFRYIDEQAFRFNNRTATDAERFTSVMKQIVGRRLTYAGLTGKSDSQRGPRP
jgi:transposase-like protein